MGKLKSQIHNYCVSLRIPFRCWPSEKRTSRSSLGFDRRKGIYVLCKSSLSLRFIFRLLSVFINSSPEFCGECVWRQKKVWTRSLDAGNGKKKQQTSLNTEAKNRSTNKRQRRKLAQKNHFQSSRFVCETNSGGKELTALSQQKWESRCLWKLLRGPESLMRQKKGEWHCVYGSDTFPHINTDERWGRKWQKKQKQC